METLERTIEWHNGTVSMIDQRVLPLHYEIRSYTTYQGVAEAIHTMVIRGAPAIGGAAGFGMALAGRQSMARPRRICWPIWKPPRKCCASRARRQVNLRLGLEDALVPSVEREAAAETESTAARPTV